MLTRTVALVACVNTKKTAAAPARQLYCSDWFGKACAYANHVADEWYVLSAKYGLLAPDTVIAPFNETLERTRAATGRLWAARVPRGLSNVLEPGDRVILLAGVDYRANLVATIRAMGCTVEVPMERLRIGEQRQWLNQELERIHDST